VKRCHVTKLTIVMKLSLHLDRFLHLLAAPVTTAGGDLFLSPQCRLLADGPACDDYTYDGAGHRIVLPDDIKVC
jgi:hypothetical protein